MSKKLTFVLLAAAFFALAPTSALFACSASCGGNSCTGTGTCSCVDGSPVCSDAQQKGAAALAKEATYARSFNTPGLNRYADATEKIADALVAGDKDAYFIGVLEREDALKSLTPKEHQILNSWDGGDSRPTGPVQK